MHLFQAVDAASAWQLLRAHLSSPFECVRHAILDFIIIVLQHKPDMEDNNEEEVEEDNVGSKKMSICIVLLFRSMSCYWYCAHNYMTHEQLLSTRAVALVQLTCRFSCRVTLMLLCKW